MADESATLAETPIARCYRKLVILERPQYGLSDEARAERCSTIEQATTVLMRYPAETLDDIACKLSVLSDRLREMGDVGSETGRLTLLIADSARADVARLALRLRAAAVSGADHTGGQA